MISKPNKNLFFYFFSLRTITIYFLLNFIFAKNTSTCQAIILYLLKHGQKSFAFFFNLYREHAGSTVMIYLAFNVDPKQTSQYA